MDIEEKLSNLRSNVETAQQRKLRSEMAAEAALKERDAALSALKEEFGVESVEDAHQTLKKLKNDLDTAISEAEAVLKDVP